MSEKLYRLNKYLVMAFILLILSVVLDMLIEPLDIISHFFDVYSITLLIIIILFFSVPIIRIGLFLIKTDNNTRKKKVLVLSSSFIVISLLSYFNIFFNNNFPLFEGVVGGIIVAFHDVLFHNPS